MISLSPSIRKSSSSPIKGLQITSPRRQNKLQTIFEQQVDQIHKQILSSNTILQTQNINLSYQNQLLNTKIKTYVDKNIKYVVENNKLKQQNSILLSNNYLTNSLEIQKLNLNLLYQNNQTQTLKNNISIMKNYYDRNVDHFILENQNLKNQLQALQYRKIMQAKQIKQKLAINAQQDLHLVRKGYNQQVARLSNNLKSTKDLLTQKQLQLKHLQLQGQNSNLQHNAYLQQLISQNNILRNRMLQLQMKKQNQIKHVSAMKQLQKSRTHGIITYCKQNTAFMEKQVSKLAEQLLEKSISIQQFTKQIIKIKRNLQQTQKRYEQRISKIQLQCDQKINQTKQQMQKLQKFHKYQAAQNKKTQMQLQQIIQTKTNQLQTLQKQNKHHINIIKQKQKQMEYLKSTINKLHQDHNKQMSKVMSDNKSKRKSVRNPSEVSSLRDLSVSGGGGGSQHHLKEVQKPSPVIIPQDNNLIKQLSIVKEQEIAASKVLHNEQQIQLDLGHDGQSVSDEDIHINCRDMMQELKRDKQLQLNLVILQKDKLFKNLQQKQQQILQILSKFSPLMEYKLNSKSIEIQRKQKIQKHYKANIDLLTIMLDKYGISALSKYQ